MYECKALPTKAYPSLGPVNKLGNVTLPDVPFSCDTVIHLSLRMTGSPDVAGSHAARLRSWKVLSGPTASVSDAETASLWRLAFTATSGPPLHPYSVDQ